MGKAQVPPVKRIRGIFTQTTLALVCILLVALLLRLRGLDFGLPAILDPDEAIFVFISLKLLRDTSLNPGWFGHPGTTTLYALALVEIGVYLVGHLTGRFTDTDAFVRGLYADPAVVFLPGRIFILICGLAVVGLTWRLGRALFGNRVGLFAAALTAIDPVQIRYSQIIRTDMQATVFILLIALATVRFVRAGHRRDLVVAGVALGFAVATKWPAATALAGILGGCVLRWREHPDERRRAAGLLLVLAATAVAALFVASPYIFIDYATVLSDLHGEVQPAHLGSSGNGPLDNLRWYVSGPILDAFGLPGLGLVMIGTIVAARASRAYRYVALPVAAGFLVLFLGQHLVWERWLVPVLPLLTVGLAVGCDRIVGWLVLQGRGPAGVGLAALAAAVAGPPLVVGNAQAAERATDTRRLATAWLRTHVRPGNSVAIDYLAFDVLPQPWRFLYPAGDRGCVDVRANLAGKIRVSTISQWRGSRALVDIGTIAPETIATCRADFIVSANWDRYRAESTTHTHELRTYAAVTAGGQLVATFRPVPGEVGGDAVRIWQLPPGRAAAP